MQEAIDSKRIECLYMNYNSEYFETGEEERCACAIQTNG